MEHPSVIISVYPEHFTVSLDYNGQTIETSGALLSTALYDLAEEVYANE